MPRPWRAKREKTGGNPYFSSTTTEEGPDLLETGRPKGGTGNGRRYGCHGERRNREKNGRSCCVKGEHFPRRGTRGEQTIEKKCKASKAYKTKSGTGTISTERYGQARPFFHRDNEGGISNLRSNDDATVIRESGPVPFSCHCDEARKGPR